VAIKANPSRFVDAQFENWDGEGCPQPSNLYSEAALKRYGEFKELDRCPPKMEVENQVNYLKNYTKEAGMTRDGALLAPFTAFRSYFRVLACSDDALPLAMRRYGSVARQQVMGDTQLLKYLEGAQGLSVKLQRLRKQECEPSLPVCEEPLPQATPISESWENQPTAAAV
jgi:hypothetical protein